jgi:hypothetical protein
MAQAMCDEIAEVDTEIAEVDTEIAEVDTTLCDDHLL